MKNIIISVCCLLVCGCVTSESSNATVDMTAMSKRFVSFRLVREGMTEKEVRSVLPTEIVVGYELINETFGQYKPITAKNPYRTEQFLKDGANYAVLFYLEGVEKPDGRVADNELMPVVFRDGVLDGMGYDHLKRVK